MVNPMKQASPHRTERAGRALVVDDHPIVADAMAMAIGGMRVFESVSCASSLDEACRILDDDPACDLAVLDLHLRDVAARETLIGFREKFPDVPVLVFSGDEALESITLAFECGARGYVTKSSPMQVVESAIRLVLSGGSFVPAEMVQLLGLSMPAPAPARAAPQASPLRLSARQEQVFRLLLQGMPNKVIGSRLSMAEGTVKAHLNAIFGELRVRTRVEAILRARQLGLI